MKINKSTIMAAAGVALLSVFASCGDDNYGDAVEQVNIDRIEMMPNMPQPYHMLDWKQKAKDFDAYIFDENPIINGNHILWLDSARRNIDQVTFGIYTAIDDSRQGPKHNNGEFHESLNSLAALIGGTLVGIDKSNQNGMNYVKMVQNYFNSDTGWNIIMNNTNPSVAMLGGGYGRDWWYDVFPNVLYYALCDLYPNVDNAEKIQRSIAEQFCKADSVLNGNYDYSYFDYGQMKGMVNHIPLQQDAAGGHAWVLYSAYKKFGDKRYLQHAKSALDVIFKQKESRFYEILLPMSAIVAAHLNAEEGTNYDIKQIIDWTFDGCTDKNARYGWGVIAERWGNYDVYGLQGSITDNGGFAFFMNSVKLTWPMVPMVKYEPQYARAIGKWMLNLANACRLFYPKDIAPGNQWLPEMADLTRNNIAYEGLRKSDDYGKEALRDISPVAVGDGPKWTDANPPESMFSVYSSSPVGILGAMVATTDVEGILQIDCNVTDFYAERPYPVYLYYNPYKQAKEVTFTSTTAVDLFDIVAKRYVAKNLSGSGKISIPADMSRIVVVLPAGTSLQAKGDKIIANNQYTLNYK
jgi:hypothetical protein